MTITAAVDGSALGNPGPAGWAWVVSDSCWDAGGWAHGTNNLGELTAVLELLRATERAGLADEPLHVLADSQYAINVITKWRHGWKKRGWAKADKKPIANLDVIRAIDSAIEGRPVTFEWVRGHAGHAMNEMADSRARAVAEAHQAGTPVPTGPGFPPSDGAVVCPAPVGEDEGGRGVPSGRGGAVSPSRATPSRAAAPLDATATTASTATPTPAAATTDSPAPATSSRATPSRAAATLAATATPTPAAATTAATTDSPARAASSRATPAPTRSPTAPSPATPSPATPSPADAEKQFIRAWAAGDHRRLGELGAPDVRRVWPGGSVTEGLAGPTPADLRVGRLSTREVGSGAWLVTYRLSWQGGAALEASLWELDDDGEDALLRLVWHQSTPVEHG